MIIIKSLKINLKIIINDYHTIHTMHSLNTHIIINDNNYTNNYIRDENIMRE